MKKIQNYRKNHYTAGNIRFRPSTCVNAIWAPLKTLYVLSIIAGMLMQGKTMRGATSSFK